MHSEHTLTRAHLTDHQIRTADATDAQEQWLLFDQKQKTKIDTKHLWSGPFERQKRLQKNIAQTEKYFS